jgi:hypothetical protein
MVLCVLGVALGVAVVVAIDLANASARRAFQLAGDTIAGQQHIRLSVAQPVYLKQCTQ